MGCAKTSDYEVDLGLPQLCRRRIEYGLIPAGTFEGENFHRLVERKHFVEKFFVEC